MRSRNRRAPRQMRRRVRVPPAEARREKLAGQQAAALELKNSHADSSRELKDQVAIAVWRGLHGIGMWYGYVGVVEWAGAQARAKGCLAARAFLGSLSPARLSLAPLQPPGFVPAL